LFSQGHESTEAIWQREEPVDEAKPFDIPKREVWEAFKKVKANQGAAGVDGQSIADFEADLSNNLYKLWNRLSSGSYFPPPVRRVDIPKANGGTRPLGIPTVADRIAQEVARRYLEPRLEPAFHADSYGYRPGRSAIDAVRQARQRCWRYDWVLDIDVKGYFDSIDWELMLKAVRRHTNCPWVLLYIERWLKAPVQMEDGSVVPRTAGTPQGGVVSPILANLFLHYAFDMWMARIFPHIPFERYADDIICHCKSPVARHRLRSDCYYSVKIFSRFIRGSAQYFECQHYCKLHPLHQKCRHTARPLLVSERHQPHRTG
jgi:group II intron reverse transcriptase/maturase